VVIARFDLKTPGREPEAAAPTSASFTTGDRATGFITALGGAANLTAVEACTTRLRLQIADSACVDEAALKALGARGLVRPSAKDLQVVLGPHADDVAREIRAAIASAPAAPAAEPPDAETLAAALGGVANIAAVSTASSRLRLAVRDADGLDEARLRSLGLRAVARPARDVLHLIVGPNADALGAALRALPGARLA
jgi:PTS system N-acetylglucosamine-specific IIC component